MVSALAVVAAAAMRLIVEKRIMVMISEIIQLCLAENVTKKCFNEAEK